MRIISPSLFFFFSFHLGTIAMAMVYEGTCKITKVIDANMNDIEIPAGNFLIKTQKHFHEHIVDDEVYDVSIKIGNSMGTSLKILGPVPTEPDDDKIEIGPIRSTMMMPPEKLYKLEMAISDVLPAVDVSHIEGDKWTLRGPKGQIECLRLN